MSFERIPNQVPKTKKYKFKNGDMIFGASGNDGKSERLIRWGTLSPITHVGIVITIKSVAYIFHSDVFKTGNPPLDYLSKKRKRDGVVLNSLSEYIRKYKGNMWVRPIKKEIEGDAILQFAKKNKDKGFESSTWEIINAQLKIGMRNAKPSLKEYFCSELIAQFFIEQKWLPADRPSKFYTPKYFTTADIGNKKYLNKMYKIKTV